MTRGFGEMGLAYRACDNALHEPSAAWMPEVPLTGGRAQLAARFVVRLLGMLEGVGEEELLSPTRGPESTARLRQIAMYLLHTSLSVPYGEVARAFGRDRTTVSHACRLVEDLRDDPAADSMVEKLEVLLSMVSPLFAPVRGA